LTYFDQKNYPKALDYFQRALKITEELGEKSGISKSLKNMGDVYQNQGEYVKALEYYHRALKIAQELGKIPILKDIYHRLSKVYARLGKHDLAYKHLTLSNEMKNKLDDITISKKLTQMEIQLATHKKEKEIELLNKEKQIQKEVIKQHRIQRILLFIILFLLVIIFGLFFKKYKYLFSFWKKKSFMGHYKLIERIATGGMGTIYKARNIVDKTTGPFALKVIKEESSKDESRKRRFKHESLLIDQLDHPNIVKVVERGEHEGDLYLVMEFLNGKTLAELLKEESQLKLKDALNIAQQVASALIKVHSKDIIHRDLKPDNIMLIEKDGNPYFVKLLDFGIAKSHKLTQLTESGLMLGTLIYLTPEQVSAKKLTVASDVFALGVVFYEMLAGKNPFSGETSLEIMRKILNTMPMNITQIRDDIPEEINGFIMQMLEKEAERRPTILEVYQRIQRLSDKTF
jgi:tetratricopeptide (TPR) repeat protein